MSKNIIIGVVVVAVVAVGGYYLTKNASNQQANNTPTTENPVSKTPPAAPVPAPTPGVPLVVTGANPAVSSSTMVVNGQVRPNGAPTTYWYEYGETTALGNRTVPQQIGSGYSLLSTPAFVTGLKANTVYYYRLSANNRFATVNGATFNVQTNNLPPPTGVAPALSTNNATNISRTAANVNGMINPNGWQTNFWFEYGLDLGLGSATEFQSAGNGVTYVPEAMSLSNLQPQTKYFFRVDAQNQFGTVNGATLSFTTSGPVAFTAPTVSTVAASNISKTGAKLKGRVNPNGIETNYWFEYSLDSLLGSLISNGTSIQTLPAGTNSVDVELSVTGLASDTTYHYRVVGRNSAGTVQGSIMSFKTDKAN